MNLSKPITIINEKGNANKFWKCHIDQTNTVHTSWGRLGTKGQTKAYSFTDQYTAEGFIQLKITEKLRDGYKEVDDKSYGLATLRAEMTGAGCKVGRLHFLKSVTNSLFQILYDDNTKLADLADPKYVPYILCEIILTGNRGTYQFIITTDKISVVKANYRITYHRTGGELVSIVSTTDIDKHDDYSPVKGNALFQLSKIIYGIVSTML